MHRGLLKLMRFQARSVVRRIFRNAKTVRGLVFLVVGSIIFVMWLGGTLVGGVMIPRVDPAKVMLYFPPGMLAFCVMTLVTSAGDRAIAFTPAEVDFLFPGPFSRRQLLGYKIARSALGALFSASLFSFILLRYARHWIGAWIAVFLAMIFIQLLSMAVVLVGQMIGEAAFSRGRRLAMAGAVIAALAIARAGFGSTGHSVPEIATEFTTSQSGKIVLAPFSVFARILTSDAIVPDALKWAGVAIAMLFALLLLVIRLDAHYLEMAASTGQKVYDRIQRFRRGGGISARASSARLRIPMLPRFAGGGAIAWRQLNTALRTSRSLIFILLIIGCSIGPAIYHSGGGARDETGERVMAGLLFWMMFVLSNILRFDFRGDLDLIDTLKALPVKPAAIAVAQLVAPVAVLTALQLAVAGGISVMLPSAAPRFGLAMLFALPLNILLIATENLIFLVFPARMAAVSPGDLQGFGRQMLVFLMKSLVMIGAIGVAALAGVIAYWISGHSWPAVVVAMLAVLAAEIISMIPLLVIAFRNFDPSVDTPA
jgi:hypothetical protein